MSLAQAFIGSHSYKFSFAENLRSGCLCSKFKEVIYLEKSALKE